jgi:hypothetical protein
VDAMDEARFVLERLHRIDELKTDGAPAEVLLNEVRALLGEAEAWLDAEGPSDRAARALDSSRGALADKSPRAPA